VAAPESRVMVATTRGGSAEDAVFGGPVVLRDASLLAPVGDDRSSRRPMPIPVAISSDAAMPALAQIHVWRGRLGATTVARCRRPSAIRAHMTSRGTGPGSLYSRAASA